MSLSTAPSAARPTDAARRGALAATVCYFAWGLVPLYWKQLAGINPVELIAHRHVWSLVLVLLLVVAQKKLGEVRAALSTPGSVGINLLSSVLLTTNWLIYVWGVNTGHVIECSLGYFLVPLVNVAVGRFVLHEQLRALQWIAIASAALGVAWMVVQLGHPPWIALGLATTWGGYGFLRKKSPLGSLTGLTVETLLLAPLAVGFLLWQQSTGEGALGRVPVSQQVLVLSAGLVTAIPLLMFAYGAQRIRLTTMGLLQYIVPTIQFGLGVWLYHEPFSRERLTGFLFIWAGLALYTADNLWEQRNARAREAALA